MCSYARFSNLMNSLPNLEYLSLNSSVVMFKISDEDLGFLKTKRLKYFGFSYYSIETYPRLEEFAKTVGTCYDLESLLTNFEYAIFSETFLTEIIIKAIIEKVEADPQSVANRQWKKLEMVILILIERCWNERPCYDTVKYSKTIFELGDNVYTWSQDFMEKFVNLIVNYGSYEQDMEERSFVWIFNLTASRQILNFMLKQITRTPNIMTSKMCLYHLILKSVFNDLEISDIAKLSNDAEVCAVLYREIPKT